LILIFGRSLYWTIWRWLDGNIKQCDWRRKGLTWKVGWRLKPMAQLRPIWLAAVVLAASTFVEGVDE
jgi:hypothetical protein